jgi:starch phosphorylase
LFYNRGEDKIPRGWIQVMKNSMKNLGPIFNTNRMVQEYSEKYYLKAQARRKTLMEDDWKKAKEFTEWKTNLIQNWDLVKFVKIETEHKNGDLTVGSKYVVNAEVNLGNLTESDVEVQIYYGRVDDKDIAGSNKFVTMDVVPKKTQKGNLKYKGEILCQSSGQFGYTLRILPKNALLINPFELGLIRWAK